MNTYSSPSGFVALRRQFEFRSIEVGRWVTPAEMDQAATRFQKALNDLKSVLKAPECLVSLRATLGIQYGIGGQPGISAHYTPATRQLALAKNAGAGSLAHEWFHAFDHYMGAKMFEGARSSGFASFNWINSLVVKPHVLNDLLANCFNTILLSPDGTQPSELFLSSQKADQAMNVLYYAKPEELCARAFEAFVEDAAPTSSFLVKGSRQSDEAKAGLYPVGQHRQTINEAFEQYFTTLGKALYRESRRAG